MENLLEPIQIKNTIIPSRIFFAPINTGYSYNGAPTEELIAYYKKRAGKNIGITYVGNVAIGKDYCSNNNTCYFPSEKSRWIELSNSIKKNGSLAGIQISCNNSIIPMQKGMVNFDIYRYINETRLCISSMKPELIETIINKFVNAIAFAKEVGFDVVQIHAAHGYFLSLFVSHIFNVRNDIYGKNRSYCIEKIIKECKKNKIDIIIDVRLSLMEGILKNVEIEKQSKLKPIENIINSGADIISFSNGIYNIDKTLIYPNKDNVIETYNFTKNFKNNNIIWNFCGAIKDLNYIGNVLNNSSTVSLGRAIMTDPQYIEKYYSKNQRAEIKNCSMCGKCHYYSRGEAKLYDCSFKF